MHLLVVEDDPKISHFLVRGLREDGHRVDLAEEGETAERLAASKTYDAVLLDVLLPGRDGLQICRRLRDQGIETPILMLTALDAVHDRVQGLDTGADDYLTKPFAFDELLARLRALVRRGRKRNPAGTLTYGRITIETDTRRVQVAGHDMKLTATEYRLLAHLVRRAESIVSRDELAEHVWGGDYDPTSNLADVYVGYLRRKIRATGVTTIHIYTIRGMGYMLKDQDLSGEPA